MMGDRKLRGTLFCIALLVAGCSSPSGPTGQSTTDAPGPEPAPAATQAAPPALPPEANAASSTEPPPAATPVEPAPALPASAPSSPAAATAPPPSPAPKPVALNQPAPTPPAPSAPAAAPGTASAAPAAAVAPVAAAAPAKAVVDPGGPVAVAETKPGLKRVGSEKCGMCHDVQFESWEQTAHAARKPPLDCESCHGPGSGYGNMAVMKDPAKARAAGLVIPDRSFCSQCHKKGVTDDFLKRAHAHSDQAG